MNRTKQKNLARQPALRRLSSPRRKVGGRRARHQSLFNGRLDVSLRYFRTNPASRTKQRRQYIIQLYLLPVRELAITHKTKPKASRQRLAWRPALPVLIGLAGLIYFSTHLLTTPSINLPVHAAGQVKAASTTLDGPNYPRSVPTELVIPKIGIDANVQPIGLNSDDSLAVPADYHAAGWYAQSPTPGQIGPSVVDGHVDNVAGIGVFWRLRELTPGDTFSLKRADSSVINFKIERIDQFPQAEFPTAAVYGKINYAGIRLITCGGVFNTASHHYTDNIVVFGRAI